MSSKLGAVILAAGKGTRLKLNTSKPLAPIMGLKLVDFVIKSIKNFEANQGQKAEISLVTGHYKEELESYLNEKYGQVFQYAFQEQQLGTGHAVQTYLEKAKLAKELEYTLVLCADTPLLEASDIEKLYQEMEQSGADAVCATFKVENPNGYGRIVRGVDEYGFRIVEQKDANERELLIDEVNSGVYIFKTSYLLNNISNLDSNNKSGEFYLTDLFNFEANVKALTFSNPENFQGVNDLAQLEEAERVLRQRKNHSLRAAGVRFVDSSHTYIQEDVTVGEGTLLYPNVILEGATIIGERCVIESGTMIKDTKIGNDVSVLSNCHFEDSIVSDSATIGPMARLRPKSDVGVNVKIGNFVEIKKSILKEGSKVSHHSYVGDAEIGEEANIGCGFITCNYDGANKHKTIIGKGSFIGSDSQAIAPVTVGEGCYVASGTTLTHDLQDGDFAISRGKQVTKIGMARRFLKKK